MKIPGRGLISPVIQQIQRTQKKLAASKGVILMYHRIAEADVDPWALCVTPQNFAEQLAVIKAHYHPLSLQQLAQAQAEQAIPERAVAITFDDGYADNLYQAKPLLERYEIPATVFVVTGNLGREEGFWWDRLARSLLQPGQLPDVLSLRIDPHADREHRWELGAAAHYSQADYEGDRTTLADAAKAGSRLAFYYDLWQTLLPLPTSARQQLLNEIFQWAGAVPATPPSERSLSPAEVITLSEGELIEIGAHTVTHPFLSTQPLALQQVEIQQSKTELERILQQRVATFSYPFGNRCAQTVALAQQIGFDCACSTVEDIVWRRSERFQLPRITVQNWPGADFSQRLQSWFEG
jgi:peptidoglycan/xylan/chitin deacetylase (PgdA/CDA1 family)